MIPEVSGVEKESPGGGKLFTTTKVHFRIDILEMGTTASQLGKDLLSEYQVSARRKSSKRKCSVAVSVRV